MSKFYRPVVKIEKQGGLRAKIKQSAMPGEERTMADASSVGEKRKLKEMSSDPSHEDEHGPDSDLAPYLGKPGLHPTNDLGLSLPGGELEVLWDVSNDSQQHEGWVNPLTHRDGYFFSPKFRRRCGKRPF